MNIRNHQKTLEENGGNAWESNPALQNTRDNSFEGCEEHQLLNHSLLVLVQLMLRTI